MNKNNLIHLKNGKTNNMIMILKEKFKTIFGRRIKLKILGRLRNALKENHDEHKKNILILLFSYMIVQTFLFMVFMKKKYLKD